MANRFKSYGVFLVPIMGALVVLLLAGMSAYVMRQSEAVQEQDHIRLTANRVQNRLQDQLLLLDATKSLVELDPGIDRQRFQQYLDAISPGRSAPGMQGIGFALAQDRAAQVAAARIARDYGFPIEVWPATRERVRFPIVMLEPLDARNAAALGFDMYAEPVRRAAMQRAIACKCFAMSDIVELVQEISGPKQPGFLIYTPVHQSRGGKVFGFVYAPFRVRDFLRSALALEPEGEYAYRVHAGATLAAPVIFEAGPMPEASYRFPIKIADRQWTLVVGQSGNSARVGGAAAAMGSGLIGALLVAILLWSQGQRADAMQALAIERDARARDRQLLLEELAHRQKNGIARINAIVSLTAREAGTVTEFAQIVNGRISALAAAQDRLIGIGSKATLDELVSGEVHRMGNSLASIKIGGPPVMLDEQTSQSVVLALHELATNSIKYGSLGNGGGLDVQWQEQDGAITLDWRETGLDVTPNLSEEGFGTRLIRTMLERQCSGRFERSASPGTFTARLVWPYARPAATRHQSSRLPPST